MELNKVVENFGPQWFAPTMGIGALAIALTLVHSYTGLGAAFTGAQAFTAVTAILTAVFLVPWTARFFLHPEKVRKALSHPIRSQFFPTMPITLIVLGIAVLNSFPGLSQGLKGSVGLWLFSLGSIGIFFAGVVLSRILFTNTNIETKHGVFAWFIPPVSHIVIPVLGLLLLQKGLVTGAAADAVALTSLAGLGIGTLMFLFLAPVILYRYAYEDLPDSKLAPTFIIGIAPTSILIIDLAHLKTVLSSGILGISMTGNTAILDLVIGGFWGFSAWWFLLTAAIILHYIREESHPFEFTWWAYTFPLGAFTISTFTASHTLSIGGLKALGTLLTGLLLVVVIVVSYFTGRTVVSGEAFEPE